MQIKYFVSGVLVSEKPDNGERYIEERWVDGRCAVKIEATATTPAQREQQKSEEEKTWRNEELAYIDMLNFGESFPYFAELEVYKQQLRDYPTEVDFPYCGRPIRPLTNRETPIIN